MLLSIGGETLSFGKTGLNVITPLPKITVSGKNFIRNGAPYKLWGWHSGISGSTAPYIDFLDPAMHVLISREMNNLAKVGTNCMRIFVQLFECVSGPNKDTLTFSSTAESNILKMLDEARKNGIYIKLCGANVWKPASAPAWFDLLGHADRWVVYKFFYRELVKRIVAAGHATTIVGYDLMGEPVANTDPAYPWYGEESYPDNPEADGLYFNPCIARGPGVDNNTVRTFLTELRNTIRLQDPTALVTVGTFGFVGGFFGHVNTQDILDFVSPHIYPFEGVDSFGLTQVQQVTGWAAATCPVVCGEYTSMASLEANEELLNAITANLQGVIDWGEQKGPGYLPEDQVIDSNLSFLEQLLAALKKYATAKFISIRKEFTYWNK